MMNLLKPFFKLKKEFEVKTGSTSSNNNTDVNHQRASSKWNTDAAKSSNQCISASSDHIYNTNSQSMYDKHYLYLNQPSHHVHIKHDRSDKAATVSHHLTAKYGGSAYHLPKIDLDNCEDDVAAEIKRDQYGRSKNRSFQQQGDRLQSQPSTPMRVNNGGMKLMPTPSRELQRKSSDSMLTDLLNKREIDFPASNDSKLMVNSMHTTNGPTHAYHCQTLPNKKSPRHQTSSSVVYSMQESETSQKDFDPRLTVKHQDSIPFADDEISSESDHDQNAIYTNEYYHNGVSVVPTRVMSKLNNSVLNIQRNQTGYQPQLSVGSSSTCGPKRNSIASLNSEEVQKLLVVENYHLNPINTYSDYGNNGVLNNKLFFLKDTADSDLISIQKNNSRMEVSFHSNTVVRSKDTSTMTTTTCSNNTSKSDFGRHSLKLDVVASNASANRRSHVTSFLVNPTVISSSGSTINKNEFASGNVAWSCRKDYDPRKSNVEIKSRAGAAAAELSTSEASITPLSISNISNNIPEHLDRDMLQRNVSDANIAKMSCELRKDLEILAQNEDLDHFSIQKSAFSPHCSLASPIITLRNQNCRYSYGSGSLSASNFRSKSAAVLNNEPCQAIFSHNETYDSLMLSSISQLSLKLRRCSNEFLVKLRNNKQLSRTPSPLADVFNQSPSKIPSTLGSNPLLAGFDTTSQQNEELCETLRNLKVVEYQLQCADRALFPQAKSGRNSALGSCSEDNYLAQLERINYELRGFTPIERDLSSFVDGRNGQQTLQKLFPQVARDYCK